MGSTVKVGPQLLADGSVTEPRASKSGAAVTSLAHGNFYEAVSRGSVFFLATGAAAPTAFTGGAGGTPLLSVFNPANSGKNLSLLAAGIGVTAIPTAAGLVNPDIYAGISATPTGTATAPRNMLSQLATGSVALGSVNAATTGSTALTLVATLSTFLWETAAGSSVSSNGITLLNGLITIGPGVMAAIGVRTVPTSLTTSVMLAWEEIAL